jgi:hypothetical protein
VGEGIVAVRELLGAAAHAFRTVRHAFGSQVTMIDGIVPPWEVIKGGRDFLKMLRGPPFIVNDYVSSRLESAVPVLLT